MGMRYTAQGVITGVTTGPRTIWQLTCPSDAVVAIWRVRLLQLTKALAADAQALRWIVQRASAAGSSPTSVTPRPMEVGFAAAGSTFGQAPTGAPTLTGDPLVNGGFNNLSAQDEWTALGPAGPLWLSPSGIVACQVVPTITSSDIGYLVEFEEIGG